MLKAVKSLKPTNALPLAATLFQSMRESTREIP